MEAAGGLPLGTVTFVFTDIEGSTRLLQALGDEYRPLLERHHALVEGAVADAGGVVVANEGDGFFLVFQSAVSAVAATVDIQRRLAAEPWPPGHPVRVRIGVHTGEGRLGGSDYVGIDVHRAARIGSSGNGGQIVLSEATARLTEYSLPDASYLEDLGTHALKDLSNPEHLYQLSVTGLPTEFPPLRSTRGEKGNLPHTLFGFIGRVDEITSVVEAVREHRLVTLTGPAGVGKTAMALAAAQRVVDSFPDGIWHVEVSRVTEPGTLPAAVARTLAITESPGEEFLDTLAGRLSGASVLLLLDGCEHLVDEVATLADELLQRTGSVHILVTSRELLSIRGEMLVQVRPLEVPGEGPVTAADIAGLGSVALFVDRARLVQPDFRLTDANAPGVAEICRRLDGLPLAIELAAARLKMLSLAQLLTRLDHQFTVLAGGGRDVPPHQQTLQTTLDWSYQGLTPRERLLFARLSVFSGGFTLEAVEEVCSGGPVTPEMVLELLGRLVETSLAAVTETDPVRYRLLEPIARYARIRLEEQGEAEAFRLRQARAYLDLAIEADPELLGVSQTRWVERLDRERYNLRAAFETLLAAGDGTGALRLAGALRWFWVIERDLAEGVGWLTRALDVRGDAPAEVVAPALTGLGLMSVRRLQLDRAEAAFAEARDLYHDIGDRRFEGRQIRQLATVAWFRDEVDTADRLAAEAHAIAVEIGDGWGAAWALALRGTIARLVGDLDAAHRFSGESHRIFEREGGTLDLGWSLLRLGALSRDEGSYELATRYYADGRARLVEAGDTLGVSHADAGLGAMEWLTGRHERAVERFLSVLEGFGLSEEASANLFELKTMIQGNPSTAELQEIVETNRRRARAEGERGARAALAEYLYHVGRTALRRREWDRAGRALAGSLHLAASAGQDPAAALALQALVAVAAGAGDRAEERRRRAELAGLIDRGVAFSTPAPDEIEPWLGADAPADDDPLRADVAARGVDALVGAAAPTAGRDGWPLE